MVLLSIPGWGSLAAPRSGVVPSWEWLAPLRTAPRLTTVAPDREQSNVNTKLKISILLNHTKFEIIHCRNKFSIQKYASNILLTAYYFIIINYADMTILIILRLQNGGLEYPFSHSFWWFDASSLAPGRTRPQPNCCECWDCE